MLRVTPLGDHDSSYVYFVAEGVLASNTREFTDSEGKTVVEGAQAGKENLYLWNGNKTTFIATGIDYGPFGIQQTSPDGKWLAFESEKSLTGYDNGRGSGMKFASASFSCTASPQASSPALRATPRANLRSARRRCGAALGEAYVKKSTESSLPAAPAHGRWPGVLRNDGSARALRYEWRARRLRVRGRRCVPDLERHEPFETTLEGVSESGDDVFFRSDQRAGAAGQPGRRDCHLRCARRRVASPNRPPRRRVRPRTPAARRSRRSPRFTGRLRARRSPAWGTSSRRPPKRPSRR